MSSHKCISKNTQQLERQWEREVDFNRERERERTGRKVIMRGNMCSRVII